MTNPPIQTSLNVLQLIEDHIESEIKLKEKEADKLAEKLTEIENELVQLRTIKRMRDAKQQVHILEESSVERI